MDKKKKKKMETTLPRDLVGRHDDERDQRPLTKASIIIDVRPYLLISEIISIGFCIVDFASRSAG